MSDTADVIIIGAGVHGASLAFHLARRGVAPLVLERSTVAAGATGRSSGFVRMHYDLESETRLAWASFPYFRDWAEIVGGDCGFVRTGFLQLVGPEFTAALRANVAMQQRVGVPSLLVSGDDVRRLAPALATDDVDVAAYEPESGYADPTSTAAGFLAAAREGGARLVQGCRVTAITVDGGRVSGVETDRGRFLAPIVVDAAGAWAAEVAGLAGVEVPVVPWRHDTIYLGLAPGMSGRFPVVIDNATSIYFRPEGSGLMLVGAHDGSEVGGSPDRPAIGVSPEAVDRMVTRVCRRVPAMERGTFRAGHGGQDGITPDQRAIVDRAGPDGFYLVCGFSGTGFKIAPAVGACVAELILDGRASTVDISGYALVRFAENRPLVASDPYAALWR